MNYDAVSPVEFDKSEMESEMTSRVEKMTKACRDQDLDIRDDTDPLHKIKPWEFLISKKHNLVWCNVFKSGSSRY